MSPATSMSSTPQDGYRLEKNSPKSRTMKLLGQNQPINGQTVATIFEIYMNDKSQKNFREMFREHPVCGLPEILKRVHL